MVVAAPALCDRLFCGWGIYRRCCLSPGRRAKLPSRPYNVVGVSSERGWGPIGCWYLRVNCSRLLNLRQLDNWGWRIPFLVGAALAGAVWLARSAMQESPDFERQRAAGANDRPALHTGQSWSGCCPLLRHLSTWLDHLLCWDHLCADIPDIHRCLGRKRIALVSDICSIVVISVTPLVGALSDRSGRKPVLVVLSLCSAILPVTMFWLMASGSEIRALLGAVILAGVAGGVSAVGAVATAEQFPGEGRLSGLALGTTTATAIFGGFTPWLAQLLVENTGWPVMPGVIIALVGIGVLPVLLTLPETAGREPI